MDALLAAGAFIVEAMERGRSTYRLYDEALAEWMREGLPTERVHERIAHALLTLVPAAPGGRDWQRAPLYARTDLAKHAAVAGDTMSSSSIRSFSRSRIPHDAADAPSSNQRGARVPSPTGVSDEMREPKMEERISDLHLAALQYG